MYEEYFQHVNMEITEDIHSFVDNYVFGNSEYLFVSKHKESVIGYCSRCKNEYDIEELDTDYLNHNEGVICPECGARLIVKLSRYGRKNCLNEACFYYFERSPVDSSVVVCKGYYVTKDYSTSYKNPNEKFNLEAVYIFEKDKAKMFMHDFWGRSWNMRSTVFDFNQGWLVSKMCYCSFESIEKAIKGTCLQYVPYQQYAGHYSMVKFFTEYVKHPGIEQLIKIGLSKLVEDKLRGHATYKAVYWNGKDIYKMLRISRKDLKDIRESKIVVSFLFLKILQLAKRSKCKLTFKEIDELSKRYSSYIDELELITKHTSLMKADKYLTKQYQANIKQYHNLGGVIMSYKDYILDCKILEMDLTNEHVLFPKDIYTAHQNTTTQVKVKENKVYDEDIKKRLQELSKYNFKYGELFVRAAETSKELILESAELHHCVAAHYTKRYAKGETNILLIRKLSEPNKPYFTMEVKNNEVIQVHGLRNCNPEKDVEAFVRAFKKAKLREKKTKVKIPA